MEKIELELGESYSFNIRENEGGKMIYSGYANKQFYNIIVILSYFTYKRNDLPPSFVFYSLSIPQEKGYMFFVDKSLFITERVTPNFLELVLTTKEEYKKLNKEMCKNFLLKRR